MRFLRARVGGDDFLPSVTTLVSGTTLAMGLTYLARPVLTRLYTPEMFGILGLFAAAIAVLTTISSGRYDDAVMLPKEDEKSREVVFLSLSILVGLSLLTVPIAMCRIPIAEILRAPELAPYLLLLPISLLCAGTIRLTEVWLTRQKRFRSIAGGRTTQSATAVPIQLAVGFREASPWGLIGGLVLGQAAAATMLTALSWRRIWEGALPTWENLRAQAVRYRDFPIFSGPSAMLNSMSSQLPAFLLFFFFDAAVVGHYAQAYALLAVPIGLVGTSVAQVYFEKAARCRMEGGLDALTLRVYHRLFEIGLFPMMVVMIAGPDVIEFVLGADWRTAGMYAQWLAVWLLFAFVASPLTRLFDVLEKLRANLAFNALLFAVRLCVLVACGFLGRPLLAVALYGMASALMYLGLLVWLFALARVTLTPVAAFAVRTLVLATLPSLALGAGVAYDLSPGLVFGLACLAGLLYGVGLMWTQGREVHA
ncbi:MAG TPA: oligosaccharide flippase family protein [Rhodothermia bacterium]